MRPATCFEVLTRSASRIYFSTAAWEMIFSDEAVSLGLTTACRVCFCRSTFSMYAFAASSAFRVCFIVSPLVLYPHRGKGSFRCLLLRQVSP